MEDKLLAYALAQAKSGTLHEKNPVREIRAVMPHVIFTIVSIWPAHSKSFKKSLCASDGKKLWIIKRQGGGGRSEPSVTFDSTPPQELERLIEIVEKHCDEFCDPKSFEFLSAVGAAKWKLAAYEEHERKIKEAPRLAEEKRERELRKAKRKEGPEPLSELDRAMITAANGTNYVVERLSPGHYIDWIPGPSSRKALQSKLRNCDLEITNYEEHPHFVNGRNKPPSDDRIRVMLELNSLGDPIPKLIYRYVSEPSDVLIARREREREHEAIGAESKEPKKPKRSIKERTDVL